MPDFTAFYGLADAIPLKRLKTLRAFCIECEKKLSTSFHVTPRNLMMNTRNIIDMAMDTKPHAALAITNFLLSTTMYLWLRYPSAR